MTSGTKEDLAIVASVLVVLATVAFVAVGPLHGHESRAHAEQRDYLASCAWLSKNGLDTPMDDAILATEAEGIQEDLAAHGLNLAEQHLAVVVSAALNKLNAREDPDINAVLFACPR